MDVSVSGDVSADARRFASLLRSQMPAEDLERVLEAEGEPWPRLPWDADAGDPVYVNAERGHAYGPHHAAERAALVSDGPKFLLMKGGEGAGKTSVAVVKALERLRRGMSGIMVGPNLPHFKRSTWPEFRRWCPWHRVVKSQRGRGSPDWEPYGFFTLTFRNGAQLYCGGIGDKPMSWEGPNVNFVMFDEARRVEKRKALIVLMGRVRIPGPDGEPPQLWVSTTPRMNWLFDYFGPATEDDPLADFKKRRKVVTLLTADNIEHLSEGFVEDRGSGLTEAERRVLLEAAWEDVDEGQPFLPSMILWDKLKAKVPPLDRTTPLLVALDAAVSGDSFALVAVSRHWDAELAEAGWHAVRLVKEWVPPKKGKIHYQGTEAEPGPERLLRMLCEHCNVVQVAYDPYQLHDMATRLSDDGVAWFKEFGQAGPRLEADKMLLDTVLAGRLAHDGGEALRSHVRNADRKMDAELRKMRMVKRDQKGKIDLAVALSMALHRGARLL